MYRNTDDVEERVTIDTTTTSLGGSTGGAEMSTRYSPVGERENFRDGHDEDVFSDIETSMTVDEKSTQLPKAKGWKSRCTIAITILVATALPIAFMATLAALRRTYTTDSPVPRRSFEFSFQ